MTLRRVRTIPCFLLALCATSLACAQTAPWTTTLRGSWVQTGPPAQGDVILAGENHAGEIVVSDDENSAVHHAAEFLACDIERISGYKPPVVKSPSPDRVGIRLVTLGHGETPAVIDAAAIEGQWESYRIVTAGGAVWLVGSNPRGTAFAAYTLSERLGIDPLYIWTGYAPEHRDPAAGRDSR
ncbi:MAG: hypothetical protein ABSH37_16545 [Bryobacteraceae bacterium]